MKYIVLAVPFGKGDTREFPIIFPDMLTHSLVADAIKGMPHMSGAVAVAAGEINSTSFSPSCHGKSVTLNLESRGITDDSLIYSMDYLHGIT